MNVLTRDHAVLFTFIHQKAGSNNRKAKQNTDAQKIEHKTQEHGAKSTQSATNYLVIYNVMCVPAD